MDNTFQEEFRQSWLTSLIGLLVFSYGIFLLTSNEGEAVHHHHSLEETINNAITLNPFDRINPEHEGRVVHITADLQVDEPLTEPEYGVSIQAVKLKRRVQMYQWIEEHTSRSDDNDDIVKSSTDYYYVTEWRDKLVDSDSFYIRYGHENPKHIPLKTVTYLAPYVKVGPLSLDNHLKNKFSDFDEITGDERPDRRDIKLHMGIYYHCRDVWNPEVGDIRVQFYYAGSTGEAVTIIAKQQDGVLVPYVTSKGRQVALVRYGKLTITEMFNIEHRNVQINTWTRRLCGAFFMYFSVICWSKLLKILFDTTPYFSGIISGEATDTRNILLAGSVALFIIALAWIFYRPVLGASLIFAAISPFLYCVGGVYGAHQGYVRS